MLTKFTVDKNLAKDEYWFHPKKGITVNIAEIADTMTDAEAEIFMRGGCKAITKVEDTPTVIALATIADDADTSESTKSKKK